MSVMPVNKRSVAGARVAGGFGGSGEAGVVDEVGDAGGGENASGSGEAGDVHFVYAGPQ